MAQAVQHASMLRVTHREDVLRGIKECRVTRTFYKMWLHLASLSHGLLHLSGQSKRMRQRSGASPMMEPSFSLQTYLPPEVTCQNQLESIAKVL